MLAPEDRVVVGRIVGVHGVKGWVKVFSHTDPMENILHYRPWFLEGTDGWERVDVDDGRRHGKGLIARLDGCQDRDQARERFVGRQIAIHRDSLPDPGEGEVYWRDLIGLRVVLADQRDLGVVNALMETGANDVLVVRGGQQRLLIPLVMDEVVKEVDLAKGLMRVDWNPEYI